MNDNTNNKKKEIMKKLLLTTLIVWCTALTVSAQGWPANYGGVMLQGFYWDSFSDTQWSVLADQTDQFKGTFDLVWLPQSGNCGHTSMGYDDLYWFDNYNSSFGNEEQLRQLISTFSRNGIKTIADVVINHRKNLSNWVDFPKETYKGITYEMKSTDIVANDDNGKTKTWATQNGYQLSANDDTGDGWDGMRDIDHKSQNVQTIVKAYLDFLKNDLGYAGFRYDMVKGYSAEYTALYNTSAQPEFSVGECWDGTNTIRRWIDGTKADGQPTSAAFDFQFRYTVRNACNGRQWNRLSQQNDGNWPLVSINYEIGNYRRWAVTFVENHDTEKRFSDEQDPLRRDTLAANAYMLAMPGTPCVFLKHWQAYPSEIKAMVAARKLAGITNESSYSNFRSSNDYYANIIKNGEQQCLAVAVGNVAAINETLTRQRWVKAVEGYHYAYYLPATLETAYADLPSGTYTYNAQRPTPKVRLAAITVTAGAELVYTTDGSQPTAASAKVTDGSTVSIPNGTTTLKVGLLINGQVSGIVTREYVVKEQQTIIPDPTPTPQTDIPAFCTVSEGETCAFFEAPASWGNIKCWRWDNQYNYTGNQWPGVDCIFLGTADNGLKVWKWSWDGNKKSQASPNEGIIFNDGARQTADLPFENGGYYTESGLAGNVITNGISVNKRETITNSRYYDLQGRRVYNNNRETITKNRSCVPAVASDQRSSAGLKPGLYIVNGKKYLVK